MGKSITGAEARRRMLGLRGEQLRQQAQREQPPSTTKQEATARLTEERRRRGKEQWAARKAEREETKAIAADILADRTVPLFVENRKELLEEAGRVRKATKDVATGLAEVLAGCCSPWTGRAVESSERGRRERMRPR